ncbi:MAG: tRNA (adenosine(37)-N6)-threonylcarbamoyltransferase complex dimerization subunit type 1 TsaB [Tepidisphaeraceae bacterium]|jgi:tRNA threonylcarbamoyladenosine biosynthesis protein TsaB
MLRALAIETSGRIGSIALAEDGGVVVEREFPHGLQHAAHIIPIIDELCRQRNWTPRQIDHAYVSAGPGSFTGLRIGITLAKTLWLATGVKVVAVPTVRVLAENAPADARRAVIVLDAKREQIYTARFERATDPGLLPKPEGSSRWREMEPAHLDTLAAMLARSVRPVHLVGDGIPFHDKFIPQGDTGVVVTPADTWRARAGVVARLGWEMAARGEFADAMKLTPIYVRLPEAEEKYLAGRGQGG